MKKWMAAIGGVVIALIVVIPGRIEIAFVTDLCSNHPWLTGVLIVMLLTGLGWWLRRQAEWESKKQS